MLSLLIGMGPARLDPLSWTECLNFVLCVNSIILFTRRKSRETPQWMRSGEQVQLEIKASVETQSSRRVSPRRVDSSGRCRNLIVLDKLEKRELEGISGSEITHTWPWILFLSCLGDFLAFLMSQFPHLQN